jgi:hypothetical protein
MNFRRPLDIIVALFLYFVKKICLQALTVFRFLLQGRIILAPLFYVNFADFWLADQLNSLVVVFVDFQYFICFYLTNDNWMVANGKKLYFIM